MLLCRKLLPYVAPFSAVFTNAINSIVKMNKRRTAICDKKPKMANVY